MGHHLLQAHAKGQLISKCPFCFVHPIFSSFGFWYFGHLSCVIFFPVFFRLTHLALQNVNKYYVIFSYFHNFIAKSDQKPKTKYGMNETIVIKNLLKKNLPHALLMRIIKVRGSPTWTGPATLVPVVPYPFLISIWHSGGVKVKWTGSAVFTLIKFSLGEK